ATTAATATRPATTSRAPAITTTSCARLTAGGSPPAGPSSPGSVRTKSSRPSEREHRAVEFALFNLGHVPRHLSEGHPGAEHERLMAEAAVVRAGDQRGFKYAWVSEHHFLHEYSHLSDSAAFLGYLAGVT